jgi:hypothetical protein
VSVYVPAGILEKITCPGGIHDEVAVNETSEINGETVVLAVFIISLYLKYLSLVCTALIGVSETL